MKNENEHGNGAIEGSNHGTEFLLAANDSLYCGVCEEEEAATTELNMAGLTMAQKSHILRDPNIWVGDSGASSDSTFDAGGMINCKKTHTSITMGKGKSVNPERQVKFQ